MIARGEQEGSPLFDIERELTRQPLGQIGSRHAEQDDPLIRRQDRKIGGRASGGDDPGRRVLRKVFPELFRRSRVVRDEEESAALFLRLRVCGLVFSCPIRGNRSRERESRGDEDQHEREHAVQDKRRDLAEPPAHFPGDSEPRKKDQQDRRDQQQQQKGGFKG